MKVKSLFFFFFTVKLFVGLGLEHVFVVEKFMLYNTVQVVLFGFGLIFGLFHYAKLPIYKRVK